MTLEEQLSHFDRYSDKAYTRCLKDFKVRRDQIIAAARERIIAGYEEYGAAGYSWGYHPLHSAELEEAADMVNYRLMKMYQGWP
jgi:hypothetical protein